MVAFAAGKHAPLDHVQDVTALEMPRLFVAIASSRYITPGVSEVSSTSPGETGTHDGVTRARDAITSALEAVVGRAH